jgi:thiosulfate dehydrogenase
MSLKLFSALFLAVCGLVGAVTLATWRPPAIPPAPPSPAELGRQLVTRTFDEIGPDTATPYAGNRLACENCHLEAGTKLSGVPLIGVAATYPKFSARSGRVITLSERIDECMTRSMNGKPLPEASPEKSAFIAYIRSLDGPAHPQPPAPPAAQPPDSGRGQEVFERICATCHQPQGQGKRMAEGYEYPPLWGPDSFNDGAGMDHYERAVGFILRNMPRGIDPMSPKLTLQEAWDVTAFLQTRPRPHYEGR